MPLTARFQLKGSDELIKRLRGMSGPELKKKADQSIRRALAHAVVPAIRSETPKIKGQQPKDQYQHGILAKKITVRKTHTRPGEVVAYTVGPRAWYAHFVIRGTKAHIEAASTPSGRSWASASVIRKINRGTAGALVFQGVYSALVHHPGSQADPYVYRAAHHAGLGAEIATQLGKDLMKHPQ